MTCARSYRKRPYFTSKSVAGLLFVFLLGSCADFQPFQALAGLFKGNTQRDYQSYSLDERTAYRKQRQLEKVLRESEEKEILDNLDRSILIAPRKSHNSFE